MQPSGKWKILGWIGALVILLILPFFLGKYSIFLLSLLAIYALVSLGLNLLMGYTGQIAAGHAGFLAIGAYVTALVTANFDWLPCPVTLLLAGTISGMIGFPFRHTDPAFKRFLHCHGDLSLWRGGQ